MHAPTALHANIALVIFPAHAKRIHAVRLGNPAQNLLRVIVFLALHEAKDILGDFLHRLHKFGLMRIAALNAFHKAIEINVV